MAGYSSSETPLPSLPPNRDSIRLFCLLKTPLHRRFRITGFSVLSQSFFAASPSKILARISGITLMLHTFSLLLFFPLKQNCGIRAPPRFHFWRVCGHYFFFFSLVTPAVLILLDHDFLGEVLLMRDLA